MAALPETPAIGPDEDRRVSFQAVVWTLVALSTVFMALRVWARTLTRILGADDLHMAACWVRGSPQCPRPCLPIANEHNLGRS